MSHFRSSACSSTVLASTLFIALALAGCSGGGGGPAAADTPTSPLAPMPPSVEFDSFGHLNSARETNAIDPLLGLREAASTVARRHSENMRDAGFFDHVDPQGRTVAQRLQQAGVPFRAAAENLARVSDAANPAAFAHQQLMASPSHRPNILNSRFQLVGVGVARQGDSYWITQVFIDP
jgi:uncharacterized protein YkwD